MSKSEFIKLSETFTESQIVSFRDYLNVHLLNQSKNFTVVTGGSYARGEASPESDLDYFIIYDKDFSKEQEAAVKAIVSEFVKQKLPKDVGDTNTFGEITSIDTMLTNIGGTGDSNDKLTRRILFLLEAKCLWNDESFNDYQTRLLDTYIKDSVSEHHLAKFLLNDVIRYYRTICTDFEFKTCESDKSWGLRNIKLMFSRKLLYFSGVVAIADTCHRTKQEKIERLSALLSMTPIDRISSVCGTHNSKNVLDMYAEFLGKISDPAIRKTLEGVTQKENKSVPQFRNLKNHGHRFSFELTNLLSKTYDASHPIHHSLIM